MGNVGGNPKLSRNCEVSFVITDPSRGNDETRNEVRAP